MPKKVFIHQQLSPVEASALHLNAIWLEGLLFTPTDRNAMIERLFYPLLSLYFIRPNASSSSDGLCHFIIAI